MREAIKSLLKQFLKYKKGYEPHKLSYAQCGEDLIIEFVFNQLGIFKPTYLDIGAHHPFYLSNTALFYKKGCRGINIEPDFNLFKEFLVERKEDINLNVGIGEKAATSDFFVMNATTLNTFSLEQIELYKKEGNYFVTAIKKVKIETLQSVLKNSNGQFPDLLSIDAEGMEELITESIDFTVKPKVICIETLSFSNFGKGIKNTKLINFILGNGYILYADTYINSIFVEENSWQARSNSKN